MRKDGNQSFAIGVIRPKLLLPGRDEIGQPKRIRCEDANPDF